LNPQQRTIRAPAERTGVSLNLGVEATVRVRPAPPDSGVTFVRTDLPCAPSIPATPSHVVPKQRRTVLRREGAEVQMVEHLLAAIAGLEIDNVVVEVNGPELPAGDGSARLFAELLQEAGSVEQDRPRRLLTLRKPVNIVEGNGTIVALPATDGLTLSYTLDYDQPGLPPQHVEVPLSPERFLADLAPARTFVLESEAAGLQAKGFGRGASYDNVLVVSKDGTPVNNRLRFADEFARHKALDLLGDLRLAGGGLVARVLAVKSGHAHNLRLVERIARDAVPPDAVSLDILDILSVVPHRYPFLLVDRVVRIEAGRRATAVKNVTLNEPFFTGHFPNRPIMPGVLLIECMAQASGLLLYQRRSDANLIAQLVAVDGARFRRPVVPGDQLRIEVEAVRMGSRTCQVAAQAFVEDHLAAEATITFMLVETPPHD
jgi:UDP-3-O-[3-hydroxymyristoyl] N-acetylglucosamine deacetylase/3-hydroxyacyl-[acyl-carrier-protein] dehydratase